MHTARSLLYGGLPDRDPVDRDPLPWTETPSPGQRPPPLDRDSLPWTETPSPWKETPHTETPWTEPPGQRPPGQRSPWTETPPPSLGRDPPMDRQTPVKTLLSQTSFRRQIELYRL